MLITPILVAGLGYFVNNKVDELEKRIAPVEAMKPFMEMLSDTAVTKNIMGAYGIYMLKKGDDSKIAAQMISATRKDYLIDVLIDIAEDDEYVKQWLIESSQNDENVTPDQLLVYDETKDDSTNLNLTDYQKYLLRVTGKLERSELRKEVNIKNTQVNDSTNAGEEFNFEPNGWVYLGQGSRLIVTDEDRKFLISEGLKLFNKEEPDLETIKSKTYTLSNSVNLRSDKPRPPDYKNKPLIGVMQKGTRFKINTITVDKTQHVWAEIIIQ